METTGTKVDLLALLSKIEHDKEEFRRRVKTGELRQRKLKKFEKRRINLLVTKYNNCVKFKALSYLQ